MNPRKKRDIPSKKRRSKSQLSGYPKGRWVRVIALRRALIILKIPPKAIIDEGIIATPGRINAG
jgi:hypothetical protein